MQKRTAMSVAGAGSLAAVAVSVGIALNLGILRAGSDPVGDLAFEPEPAAASETSAAAATAATLPAAPAIEYETRYVDVAGPTPAAPATGGTPTPGPAAAPDPGTGAPTSTPRSPSTNPAPTPTTRPTSPPSTAPVAGTYEAADAGTVTVDVVDGTLLLLGTDPADGWTATVGKNDGKELTVHFTGPGHVQWKGHYEGGRLKIEVEDGD